MTTKYTRPLAMALFALCAPAVALSPALAKAPLVRTQAPGYYRLMLGDFEITAISDGTVGLDATSLLHEPADATERALARSFLTSPVETSVTAFLVNTGSRLVLIDTGAGALFGPTLGKLLGNLRAAGYQPEQIDDVLLSHLHPDHVGGLMVNGERAFANATIHAARRDSEYWLSQANLDKAPAAAKGFFQGAMASLAPYVASGQYKPFDADREIVPGVRARASAGHSAGHTSYVIESKGAKLVVIGDLIHVAAVQLDHPSVTIAYDSDAAGAAAARQAVFASVASEGVLVAASHVQFPGLGHLRSAGTSWQWVPANYAQ